MACNKNLQQKKQTEENTKTKDKPENHRNESGTQGMRKGQETGHDDNNRQTKLKLSEQQV